MKEENKGGRDLSLPPGLKQAIQQTIRAEIATLTTAVESLEQTAKESGAFEIAKFRFAFDKCQSELMVVKEKLADIESGIGVYQEINERRKKENEELQNTIAELTAEVALLLSTLENNDGGTS